MRPSPFRCIQINRPGVPQVFCVGCIWSMLYKVKATDGSLSQIFNVGGGFSGFIFDDIGGLSNDGTDLMAFLKPFQRSCHHRHER